MNKQKTDKTSSYMSYQGKEYLGQSAFKHGRKPSMGVLLVNLGTPEQPTTSSVRTYLAEFLSDKRVIEIPQFIWKIILHGIILRIRPAKSAKAYQKVWSDNGSPLMAGTLALTESVQTKLEERVPGKCTVQMAMRYGSPSVRQGLEALSADGAERIMVLPLYPQYSGATTGSVTDAVFKNLTKWRWVPELRLLGSYHDDLNYIQALAQSIRFHWQLTGQKVTQSHKLFISFHGMPKSTLTAGDPYFCHCHKTARLLAEELNLNNEQWEMAFQSRFGKAEWLQPYVAKRLTELPEEGIKNITVICPGFSIDCLETLEEIAIEGKKDFLNAGGEIFEYVPALNASNSHAELMVEKIIKNAGGWQELEEVQVCNNALNMSKDLAQSEGGN